MLARLRSNAPLLATVLCLVFLAMRLGGVHAHRDADATPLLHEYAHHLHGDHHGDHDEQHQDAPPGDAVGGPLQHAGAPHPGQGHAHDPAHDPAHGHAHDLDVALEALTGKPVKPGVPDALLVLLLVAASLYRRDPDRARPSSPFDVALRLQRAIHWRPPLRGPPRGSCVI
jgi:hypothetical protein